MQYRSFKGTKVSEVGLGTWQLGSSDGISEQVIGRCKKTVMSNCI
jgi:aryl-alcohol dehydrogenase-like predicted oxidoreductase